MAYSGLFAAVVISSIIFGLIALGLTIWGLWAFSRLFPRLGMQSWEGWVPVWNVWRLLERAGLPGWMALGYLALILTFPLRLFHWSHQVPFVFVVFVLWLLPLVSAILQIVAAHRIGTEVGVGGGFTVLAIVLPPLWAMLLAGRIGPRVIAPRAPGYARTGASTVAAAATIPGYAGYAPPASPSGAPVRWAPPVAPPAAPSGQWPAAPVAQAPVAQTPVPPNAPPPAALQLPGPHASSAPHAPAAPPASPAPSGPLGSTTEAEYERLAAEPFAAPPAAPLGAPLAPEPFSWTAASQPSRPEPPASSAPPMHPQASAVRPQAEPAVSEESAPQDPPPPPPVFANDTDALPRLPESDALPPLPSAFSVPPAAPPGRVQDAPSSTSAPASSWADAPPARPAPTPAQAVTRPTGITGVFDAPAAPVPDDGEFDETVVVPRRPTTAWSLVLPDGETFDLGPDTIIGRRPVAADGAETLEIPDPTRTLSKTHVRLRIEDDQPTVEDLGSTNGLLLIHDDGREEDVTPHTRVPATPHMLFGTLQVTLHRLGGAA